MCTVSFAFKRKLPCYDIILLNFIYAVSWKHLRVIQSRISGGCVRYVTFSCCVVPICAAVVRLCFYVIIISSFAGVVQFLQTAILIWSS